MQFFCELSKVDEQDDGTLIVSGVASRPTPDSVGETVTADAMREALPGYMQFPTIREMHKLEAAGVAIEAKVDPTGATRVVAKVVDPIAIKKVQEGVYRGFSVGGKVLKRDAQNSKIITKIRLSEISLVDRPCHPEAVYDVWKADGASNVAAAGVCFMVGNKALFLKRGDGGDQAGKWCFPGGKIEDGETPSDAAKRESQEEIGYDGDFDFGDPVAMTPIDDDTQFATFQQTVKSTFDPTLNDEHTDFQWADLDNPPKPLHPGVRKAIKQMKAAAAVEKAEMLADIRSRVLAKYSPEQPRDENGRFSGFGAGFTSRASAVAAALHRAKDHKAQLALAAARGAAIGAVTGAATAGANAFGHSWSRVGLEATRGAVGGAVAGAAAGVITEAEELHREKRERAKASRVKNPVGRPRKDGKPAGSITKPKGKVGRPRKVEKAEIQARIAARLAN